MATVLRRRLAPSRLQPITARTSSSIRPLSFFDALAYAPTYFLVISTLARIDNPLPMPTTIRDFRGQFQMRHRTSFAGIQWPELNKMAFWGNCCGIPGWCLRSTSYKIVACGST